MVTINDVAKAAGVSFSTVSAVLGNRRNRPGVRPETTAKILAAAKALGYRRNAIASLMANARSNLISCVARDFAPEFVSRILVGIQQAADRQGFLVKLCHIAPGEAPGPKIDRMIEYRPAGIISLHHDGEFIDELAAAAEACEIPLIRVDTYVDKPGTIRIFSDDRRGVELVLEHFKATGRRRIGLVSLDPEQYPFARSRIEHFHRYAAELGLETGGQWEYCGEADPSFDRFVDGIVSQKHRPDAFFATGDFFAVTLLCRLREAGIEIPAEMAVAGYSNFLVAQIVRPQLTTVEQHYEKMGEIAMRKLNTIIRGAAALPQDREIPVRLITRQST